jgi:2-haloacid dehalogenase
MRLSDFQVLTFDCYGTLIDWESGLIGALKPLTGRLGRPPSRDEILEAHARHESAQQRQTPSMRYSDLLAVVYKRLGEEWQVPVMWDECQAYGQSIKHWLPFADSADSLAYLKQHYKLIILSNVDNQSFAHSRFKLKVEFDAVYTAEDIGSYKPDPRNFDYMCEHLGHLGFRKSDVLHTAESLYHDHLPANACGLKSCWIYRRHGQEGFGATMRPDIMPHTAFRFTSMTELVKAHQAERAAKAS